MSYDIALVDSTTGQCLELDKPHHMKGGTYILGGTNQAKLNVTYNYSNTFRRTIGANGIRTIYGMTGEESISILKSAISQLSDDFDDDYWKATEGNVKQALFQLLALAHLRPEGVWSGD